MSVRVRPWQRPALAVAILAVFGYAGVRVRRPVPLTGLPLTITAVNVAYAIAWLNVIMRHRLSTWGG